jgi:cholest-4-en-3-one 26-monooxygenase
LSDPLPRDLWKTFPALAMIADNLMTFEPQKHAAFRPLGNALFSAAKLAEREVSIRSTCAEILSHARSRKQYDFATDVALSVSTKVILGEFLGVPPRDITTLSRLILTINAMDDPFFRTYSSDLMAAATSLLRYGMELLHGTKECSDDTVLSSLANYRCPEGNTTEQLFLAYWFPLAAGAFDTTASTIAGGIKAFLDFPSQLERLRADPTLISSAVEEMIRWVSPVIYFRRTSTEDTSFNGHHIKRGDKIILCYASANRDADVFNNPCQFDVGRTPNHHLSFGYGPHFCLGARLASLVLRIFLEEFVSHNLKIRMDGQVIYTRSAWMNRIRLMPVNNLLIC